MQYFYNSDNSLHYKRDGNGDTVYTWAGPGQIGLVQHFPNGQSRAENQASRVTYTWGWNPGDTAGYSQYTRGRLSSVQYNLDMYLTGNLANVTELYSYDIPGNVTGKRTQITMWGTDVSYGTWEQATSDPIDVSYTYRADGQVNTLEYLKSVDNLGTPTPTYTNVRYTYGYDSMGRASTLRDNSPTDMHPTGSVWVDTTQYDFAGRLTILSGYLLGEQRSYNVNGQLEYQNGLHYVYSATQNNGQITQLVSTGGWETIAYQYDGLKRLIAAASTPGPGNTQPGWSQAFGYDGFGNLTNKTLTSGGTQTVTPMPTDGATNHLTNAAYGVNGNMVWGGNTQMTYDDSNRLVSVTGYSGGMQNFGYAPDNKRIAATTYDWRYGWRSINWTLYGAHGEKLLDFRLTDPDVAGSVDNTTPFINVYPMAVHIPYLGRDIAAGISTDRLGSTQAVLSVWGAGGNECGYGRGSVCYLLPGWVEWFGLCAEPILCEWTGAIYQP